MEKSKARVKARERDGLTEITIDGEVAFVGKAEELRQVLESHRKFMDYIDGFERD